VNDNHPTFEELVELARKVPPDDTESKEMQHVRECSECQYQYVGMRLLTNGLELRRRRSRRRRLVSLAVASLVLLVAVGGGTYFWSQSRSSSPALATNETIPESFLLLRLGRGTPASGETYLSKLRAGVESLAGGNYERAINSFEQLLGERPEDEELYALLGIARYLSRDNSDETMRFLIRGSAHGDSLINRTSQWYLANLRLRRGETVRAQDVLEGLDLGEIDDRFSRSARDLLKKIAQ